jgi:hypothetical protein
VSYLKEFFAKNPSFIGDEAWVEQSIVQFNKTVCEGDWLYVWHEDGSFEIHSREKLLEDYILARSQDMETVNFIDYRGAKTFTEEVVMALSSWADELRQAVKIARACKKPKK